MNNILNIFVILVVTTVNSQDVSSPDGPIDPAFDKLYNALYDDVAVWVEKQCVRLRDQRTIFTGTEGDEELKFDQIDEPLDVVTSGILWACVKMYEREKAENLEQTNRKRRHHESSIF